jgi:hypothetical protein
MEALNYLELAINLLEDSVLFFCFFLHLQSWLGLRSYRLLVRKIPKFQADVSISMVLGEVFEPLAVVDLNSGLVSLIDDIFGDICKVL